MFRHNLLVIYRNFKRFKSTFFINLTGLSAGLACSLLIYLWVNDELSVDKFHEKDSQLFQVMENRVQAQGIWTATSTSIPLAETLKSEMPEVEYTMGSRLFEGTLSVGNTDLRSKGRYAGKDIFNMFSYGLEQGNASQVLNDKNSIVISEKLAQNLFHTTQNVIGKSIEFQHEKQFVVSGIYKGTPSNSSEQFDFVISFEIIKDQYKSSANWGNTGPDTFVLLKSGTDVSQFNKKIANLVKAKSNGEVTHRTLFLRPYSSGYLHGKYENGLTAGGRIEYVRLFSIIAVFILIIACINFMNLSTAKASGRIKEVGIKKAIGAYRETLIYQYLGESMLMTFLSLFLSVLLVLLFLPQFNEITNKNLTFHYDPKLIFTLLGVVVFTGLISGSYPALYLSGFNPISVLKGKLNISTGEVWARKGLVVFQFTISVILIVSVIVVYKQVEFVQSENLGYNKDNIVYFMREGKLSDDSKMETFLSELKNTPGVVNASSIGHDMTGHNSGTSGIWWEGKAEDNKTEFENVGVNYEMMQTLGIQMKEGRLFSRDFSADSSKIIFNEAAVKFMGMKDPVGKTVKLWGNDMQIVGIAKDFHFESLHENVKPLFFRLAKGNTYLIMAKIAAGKEKPVITSMEELYKRHNPGFSLNYKFLDQEYQAQYAAELRVAALSKYFAGLAILISCLGLFGLAAFTAERRLKEIGIRKVLGSSVFNIVYLLSSDFTKLVIAAIVIALPVSYLITGYWLQSFALHIDLQVWYFLGAGVAALAIAWLTVGMQAVKAANVNPLECLKSE
ncbi:ABC transporter permease [Dyadobacter frigoris]|uniref:FtsX-like permease family protein n=1 Tax=Dyadobacter frigoris TaxID=2576211 RepID=A0A4U6D647_9BACT|nr:ABC transporter permease [Dyadobacter frigoris]TKT91711.1 FtsX-like permease family protein [Dyadobacter frigoris]GLU51722.1 ABC transporter permease [Dyadobacter frigoris]